MSDNVDEVAALLLIGEAFFETSEDEATAHCEQQIDILQASLEKLQTEQAQIQQEQAELKTILYGRFGKSIQLEE